MTTVTRTLPQLHRLAITILVRHRTSDANAKTVANGLLAAEADGLRGHGLSRLPAYAAQAASGKVDGHARPTAKQVGDAAVRVDAAGGFAYPALECAAAELSRLTPHTGIAVVAITRSHHFGAGGYHVERLARDGLVGILFGNSPKAIAPWGGNTGLFGTNPIAFAAPRRDAAPLVIDLSLSKVARGKVLLAQQQKEPIPSGWALDAEGRATTDANAAMEGTMLPIGEAKGAALVMMVEILAAALTASHFGFEASSFFTDQGEPPGVGQLLLALAPGALSQDLFNERLEALITAVLNQPGTRLPGARRLEQRARAARGGIDVPVDLYRQLTRLGGIPPR